ncbi:hypothetical protein [Priestia megaterium]|uniref:hypothetical protein n=1 Tax=Priestia megaterium TaxID=1404 RepID=UPI002877AF61|nr:hypothetical protein [Priestia megaterium]
MFHYKIDDVILTHTSPISSKQFNDMVFKAMLSIGDCFLNPNKVADYLIQNKGFSYLNMMTEVSLYEIYEQDRSRNEDLELVSEYGGKIITAENGETKKYEIEKPEELWKLVDEVEPHHPNEWRKENGIDGAYGVGLVELHKQDK